MQKADNTKIDKVIVKGPLIDDIVGFKFRDEYKSVDVDFIGIQEVVKTNDVSKYEPSDGATGIIGLQPYEDADFESFKATNFLYHMKSTGIIDHLIFAIFLKFDGEIKKATSHVKLGGFDQDTKVLRKG